MNYRLFYSRCGYIIWFVGAFGFWETADKIMAKWEN